MLTSTEALTSRLAENVETPATTTSSKLATPSTSNAPYTVKSVRTPRLPDTVTPRPVVSNFF